MVCRVSASIILAIDCSRIARKLGNNNVSVTKRGQSDFDGLQPPPIIAFSMICVIRAIKTTQHFRSGKWIDKSNPAAFAINEAIVKHSLGFGVIECVLTLHHVNQAILFATRVYALRKHFLIAACQLTYSRRWSDNHIWRKLPYSMRGHRMDSHRPVDW